MKLSRADLAKLQKALDQNRCWGSVQTETNWDSVRANARQVNSVRKAKLPKRPPPFDEPGIVLGEPLDGVGLGFDGLRPVFIVRKGDFIDIIEIQDHLHLNPNEAKYKVSTANGRFIISRNGRSWTLEKELTNARVEVKEECR